MATETGSQPGVSRRTFLATAGSVLASTVTRLRLRAWWPQAGTATAHVEAIVRSEGAIVEDTHWTRQVVLSSAK